MDEQEIETRKDETHTHTQADVFRHTHVLYRRIERLLIWLDVVDVSDESGWIVGLL